jgi:Papain family cysteine protease
MPIQNQGDCGSCVAFGTCAAIEATKKIAAKNPILDFKLSEADLFSHGGSCSYGWTLERANAAAQSSGICSEECYPYERFLAELGPLPCANQKIIKTYGATRITSDAQAKQWIATIGPLQAAMEVYEDFFYVDSDEVYHHETGEFVGGHCICIIGYDEAAGCWIGKNSWSKEWGSDGFFRIGYGECGILRSYVAYGMQLSSSPPGPGPEPTPAKPDLVAPKDGSFMIAKIFDNKIASEWTLVVNNTEIEKIGSMPIDPTMKKPYDLGSFKKGDGLLFQLKKGDIIVHSVLCYPSGWRQWMIRLGSTTKTTTKDAYFVLKEV